MAPDLNDQAPAGLRGYSRSEVEEFLAAIASERTRLESEIADANRRITRARSAMSMHRVMVAMLLDAQREFSDARQQAQLEADQIIAAAERQAQTMLDAGSRNGALSSSFGAPSSAQPFAPSVIDLSASPAGSESNGHPAAADDPDAFFSYLRGALADDRPLGPLDSA